MISDSPSSGSPTIVDPEKLTSIELWKTEIAYAEQETKKFHERARKVVRRFVDERDAMDSGQKWFNLFYANTKIMRAALYSQIPKPEVKRKFTDYKDDLGRVASSILQRAIMPDGDDPRDLFDAVLRHVSTDRLVPGLGQAWCRLETDTEEDELILEGSPSVGEDVDHHNLPENSGFKTGPAPDEQQVHQPPPQPMPPVSIAPAGGPPMGGPGGPPPEGMPPPGPGAPGASGPPQPGMPPPQQPPMQPPAPVIMKFKRITDQRVALDYVYWEDFIWSPCRVWEERRWVGRVVYMDQAQLIKRFGAEKGKAVPLNHRPMNLNLNTYPGGLVPTNQAIKQARVYEIWDRIHRKVVWLCKDYDKILDEKDDFLNLIGFEPCPKPLLANISTSNTVPRPDFYMVQDQYSELDNVNNRISLLVSACKVVGVYDRAAEGVQRMLLEGVDNTLVPVDNWAMFAEKGGVKGQVDWLPLEQVVIALQRLYENRESIKAQIYELTGIADIVRGATKASETLGAQEIKAKFASVRIKDVQDEIARFAAELLRIKAEIMVKHYDPEILIRKSNILRTDDAALASEAVELLQSEEGFEWRIVVTADQLAQTDYAMEKQDRVDLLTSVSGYLEKAGTMIQGMPQSAPLLVGMLKWAVSGFKGAREIEGMLDKTLDQLIKQPEQPKGPSPEEIKAKAEQQKMQGQMQLAQQKGQIDIQGKQQELQIEQQRAQMEMQMQERMNQMEIQMKQMELEFKIKELELEERKAREEFDMARAEAALEQRTSLMQSRMNMQAQAQQHQLKLASSAQEHSQRQSQMEDEAKFNNAQRKKEAAQRPNK
jgi:hypothetical protein